MYDVLSDYTPKIIQSVHLSDGTGRRCCVVRCRTTPHPAEYGRTQPLGMTDEIEYD